MLAYAATDAVVKRLLAEAPVCAALVRCSADLKPLLACDFDAHAAAAAADGSVGPPSRQAVLQRDCPGHVRR